MKTKTYQLIYFFYFTSTILYLLSGASLWPPYEFLFPIFKYLSVALCLPLLCMALLRYDIVQLSIIFIIGLLVMIVGINTETIFNMILIFVLFVGAKNIPFLKIVKIHFYICLCFCLINMIVSEFGWVNKLNIVISAEREGLLGGFVERKDFGYGWSTDFAIHVFFILLDYWILKGGVLNTLEKLVYVLISCFIIFECDARLASVSILLIVISSFIVSKVSRRGGIKPFYAYFLVWSTPFLLFLSYYMTVSYDSTNIFWLGLNILLSGRLSIGKAAIEDVGLPFWGQKYVMYGAINSSSDGEYNYLDSSFIQSLVIWGILLTIVWTLVYVLICDKAYKRKDIPLLFAAFLTAIVGVISQFSCLPNYCILLCAIVAKHRILSPMNINSRV